jgi:hypothetical protein
MSDDDKLPTYERDIGNHAHEWSIRSTTSTSDSESKRPQHFRVFVSIDPALSRIITIEDSQVTSDKPEARRIEGTSRTVSLTTEEFQWLLERGPEILAELQKRWDELSAEKTPEANIVRVGIDGNCAYALLGEDLQDGTAVFVRINEKTPTQIRLAAVQAYRQLCRRFKRLLPYRFDDSYPKDGGARDLHRDGRGGGN